jgi:trehalose 6-phosphate phosphatase
VSAPTAQTLRESLRPLTETPERAGVLFDIDGTLAPIVRRPEQSHVREEIARLLARLGRRYGCVGCVSGRSVAEARRLVGVGGIAYAGSHGAELLLPGEQQPAFVPAFASWEPAVRAFVAARENVRELKLLRVRIEDKGPIKAFHWRGVADEQAAETWLTGVAQEAEAEGLAIHWGRKVLEIRPPVPVDKGQAVRRLVEATGVRAALFAGDDVTDLDAFTALDALTAERTLDAAVRIGVSSAEGPRAIVDRADVVVDGVDGMVDVLTALAAD